LAEITDLPPPCGKPAAAFFKSDPSHQPESFLGGDVGHHAHAADRRPAGDVIYRNDRPQPDGGMWTSLKGPSSSAKRNVSFSNAQVIVQKPEDQRHNPANDEAGHDWEIETEFATLDDDVSGQSTEPEPTEPRP
jgi:hypothetical protein